MREYKFLDKALKWIDAVESGKSEYYVDDIQTVSDGYTFQIIHGSKSMRFFVYAKSISVFLHEIKYDCCCTTHVLFNQQLLNYANQEKVWNFAVNLYERKMSNNLNEEMEWNITVMLWGCFATVLLGAVSIMFVLWKG